MSTEQIENARVERVEVGSGYHDGRGFFTVAFVGDSWGQGINPPWTREWIDQFIKVCGRESLFACKGALVRVIRRGGMIVAVRSILGSDVAVVREDL